jgi:hypothetical protein
VWADYEQLLREIFSTFCGQKKNFFFLKHCIVRTEKLHRKKVKFFLGGEEFFFSEKPVFFRAKNSTVST